MKKKSLLLSSICTIMLCLSIVVGSTYALFTSESKVNIAVTSGRVSMYATIEEITKSHIEPNATNDGYDVVEGSLYNGTAEFVDNVLTLDKLVPGDKVTFKVNVYNNSNVNVKYKTVANKVSDNGLFDGLVITVDDAVYSNATSNWTDADAVEEETLIKTFNYSIELPTEAGNEYQDKTCELAVTVEAVQGNAMTVDIDTETVTIDAELSAVVVEDAATELKSEDGKVTAVIPANAVNAETEVNFSVKTVEIGMTSVTYEISLTDNSGEKITLDGDKVSVSFNIGTGLKNIKIKHSGVLMDETDYSYDSTTGVVTLQTSSFSPFEVSFSPIGHISHRGGTISTDTVLDLNGDILDLYGSTNITNGVFEVKNGTIALGYSYKFEARPSSNETPVTLKFTNITVENNYKNPYNATSNTNEFIKSYSGGKTAKITLVFENCVFNDVSFSFDYQDLADVTFTNCVFNNVLANDGIITFAPRNQAGSKLTIDNCTFNVTSNYGNCTLVTGSGYDAASFVITNNKATLTAAADYRNSNSNNYIFFQAATGATKNPNVTYENNDCFGFGYVDGWGVNARNWKSLLYTYKKANVVESLTKSYAIGTLNGEEFVYTNFEVEVYEDSFAETATSINVSLYEIKETDTNPSVKVTFNDGTVRYYRVSFSTGINADAEVLAKVTILDAESYEVLNESLKVTFECR